MVKFYDLNIVYQNNGVEYLNSILQHCFKLGYTGLALSSKVNLPDLNFQRNKIIPRINIVANTVGEVKRALKPLRDKRVLISVYTQNNSVANWCADSGVIKILCLNLENIKKLQRSTMKLACENNCFFEIQLLELIYNRDYPFVKKISILSEKLNEILNYGAGLIVSSGANNIFQLRAPRDVIALLQVFDIEESDAKKTVSDFPRIIFEEYSSIYKGGG